MIYKEKHVLRARPILAEDLGLSSDTAFQFGNYFLIIPELDFYDFQKKD